MNLTRIFTRSALALAVATLAACQTAPVQQGTATQSTEPALATPAPASTPVAPETTRPAEEHGAQVAVFLADMVQQDGWREIPVGGDSRLYLDPQPVITRDDLTGVQAGANQEGQGLLALMINDNAKARLEAFTARHPNKRLALVVGRTLMAAPLYTDPVNSGQLIFPVGTEANATAAARAIAGVDESGAPLRAPAAGAMQ